MFGMSRGGNFSVGSPLRMQKRFQSALQKFQRFTEQELWAWWRYEGRCVTAWTFLEHVCQAVDCPGRHSRRPDASWCRRFTGERRNWNWLPFGSYSSPRLLVLARSPDSHRQGMFCCSPSWHVGSWSRQYTVQYRLGCGNVGMAVGEVESEEVCRR